MLPRVSEATSPSTFLATLSQAARLHGLSGEWAMEYRPGVREERILYGGTPVVVMSDRTVVESEYAPHIIINELLDSGPFYWAKCYTGEVCDAFWAAA